MTSTELYEKLEKIGIIPVIKIDKPEHAVPLAKALVQGGLPAAEITFRSDAAAESIRQIVKEVPEMLVIAGTVLDAQTAYKAVEAGAKGIVSPGLNADTVDWCLEHRIPIIPGTATPSEIEFCMRRGLRVVKVFPAEVLGGVSYLKAIAGPYASVKVMPTGGVKPGNVRDYLCQPNLLCCGGTWIVPGDLLASEDFERIRELAAEAAAIREKVRESM